MPTGGRGPEQTDLEEPPHLPPGAAGRSRALGEGRGATLRVADPARGLEHSRGSSPRAEEPGWAELGGTGLRVENPDKTRLAG